MKTIKINKKEFPVITNLPIGWRILEGTLTQPQGYVFVTNNKSLWDKTRKVALMKLEEMKEFKVKNRIVKTLMMKEGISGIDVYIKIRPYENDLYKYVTDYNLNGLDIILQKFGLSLNNIEDLL